MSEYDLDKYLYKYISFNDMFIYVSGFKRHMYGVNGIIIDLSYNELEIIPDGWTYISKDDFNKIKIVTKEEVLDKVNNLIKNIIK